MNIVRCAKLLGLHANTVYARLHRIFGLTGLEARSFDALRDLLIVCDCKLAGERASPTKSRTSR
jgi:sugar diacid utilization regulator